MANSSQHSCKWPVCNTCTAACVCAAVARVTAVAVGACASEGVSGFVAKRALVARHGSHEHHPGSGGEFGAGSRSFSVYGRSS